MPVVDCEQFHSSSRAAGMTEWSKSAPFSASENRCVAVLEVNLFHVSNHAHTHF